MAATSGSTAQGGDPARRLHARARASRSWPSGRSTTVPRRSSARSSATPGRCRVIGGLLVAAIGVAMLFDLLSLLPRYFQFLTGGLMAAERPDFRAPAGAPRPGRPVQRPPAGGGPGDRRRRRRRPRRHHPSARHDRRDRAGRPAPDRLPARPRRRPGSSPAAWPPSWPARAPTARPGTLTDVNGQPGPPGRPARQGGLAQLLGELVSALPGRDAGPARHLRRLPRPRSRAHRDQRPGDEPGRCRGLRREVRPALHDRRRPVGRRLPPVPGLRPADPGASSGPTAGSARSSPGPLTAAAGRRRGRGDPAHAARPSNAVAGRSPLRPARTGSGRGRGPAGPTGRSRSCDRTTIQSSSAARRNSSPLTATESSGKSSNAVTQRGFALHGRMHRSPKNASVRPPGPPPRTTIAWWPAEWPPVGTTLTPGRISRSPSTQPSAPQSRTSRSSGWS